MSGLNKKSLVLTIGGTDYTAQISKGVITSKKADSDFQTFADVAAGGAREYTLEAVVVQDMAAGTLWRKVWTAAGTSVAFLMKPYGNAVATVAQPHFSGNVTITEPEGDLIGGEADASVSARQTVEIAWVCDAKPTEITS